MGGRLYTDFQPALNGSFRKGFIISGSRRLTSSVGGAVPAGKAFRISSHSRVR